MDGQTALVALLRSQGITVHSSLDVALQKTASLLRNCSTNGIAADEHITVKLR